MQMLRAIVQVLGTIPQDDLAIVEDPKARAFLCRLPPSEGEEWADALPEASDHVLALLVHLLRFRPDARPDAAGALRHPWLASLHDDDDLLDDVRRPRCDFPFERCQLQLDHLLLAGLDAVRATHPAYAVRVPEMLRFGIMHNRSVGVHHGAADDDDDDGVASGMLQGWEHATPLEG